MRPTSNTASIHLARMLAVVLCSSGGGARAQVAGSAAMPYAAPFLDGTGRTAPAVVKVQAHEFEMGSTPAEPGFKPDEQRHRVVLSDFHIGVHEISVAQYCEFLNERGNQIDGGVPWVLVDRLDTCPIEVAAGVFKPRPGREDHPIVTVSWRGAMAYAAWLTQKTGMTFRLPTEAEWESAARAGTSTTWPWGDDFDGTRLHWRESPVWSGQTAPVGSYPPNPWGLHDTMGNVWEWVVDCVEEDYYRRSPSQDPVLFNPQCWTPGIRGGSFADGENFCRPGHRINTWWFGEYEGVGFRIAASDAPPRWLRRATERPRVTAPDDRKAP